MFVAGAGIFLIYLALLFVDELVFHRRRDYSSAEKWGRSSDTLLLLICIGVVLGLEYSEQTRLFFVIPAIFSVIAVAKDEWIGSKETGKTERSLHAVLYMLHPLMIIALGAIWPFINGVSFFMNMVIPFSTKYLRHLCWGYLALSSLLLVIQLLYREKTKSYPKDTSPGTTQNPQET